MAIIGVIPARLHSTRLPRKLLLAETGRPLLQYAWEAAQRARSLDEVIIAADGEEIAAAARKFGARVELTGDHPSGTDRVAEVIRRCCPEAEIVVNLQGDEPDMPAEAIDRLCGALRRRADVEMATLATPIRSRAVLEDRSCVKVVCAADGRALYFSRLPIPCLRDGDPDDWFTAGSAESHAGAGASAAAADPGDEPSPAQRAVSESPWRLHLGIYAFRREFLLALTQLPPSRLEQFEKLEQLRALEAGAQILVETVSTRFAGIDTAADYLAFVERCRRTDAK